MLVQCWVLLCNPNVTLSNASAILKMLSNVNPILHGGGVKKTPPDWLSYANPRGMPRMNWFFMTLFLSTLEKSWVGHFCDFFLKIPKNFTSTIFSIYNPKGGPFYTWKNASIFGSFLGSKMVTIQLQIHK